MKSALRHPHAVHALALESTMAGLPMWLRRPGAKRYSTVFVVHRLATLRGMNPDQVLVLINGKCRHGIAFAKDLSLLAWTPFGT